MEVEKILHVTEAFGGGVFEYVSQICNALAERGIEVHLAYSQRLETPSDVSKYLHPSVVLHHVQMNREISLLQDARAIFAILRLMRKLEPNVTHLHSSKAGALGRIAARVAGINNRVCYSPHGLAFLRLDVSRKKQHLYRFFEWFGARMGGTIVACSQGELDEIRRHIQPKRVQLIENAINVAAVPYKKFSPESKVVVGTLGRTSPQKDPGAFASLAVALAELPARFIWVGGGGDDDVVAINNLRHAHVNVSGWITRDAARELLSSFDVYVQTSLWEGMPIAVIEAQVAGIPAVVTNVVGNRDVVRHGSTGFVASNQEELERFTTMLIKDEILRTTMGEQARIEAMERFGMERLVNQLIELYGRVAANTDSCGVGKHAQLPMRDNNLNED